MLTVADQMKWDALDDETKRLAREVFGVEIERTANLEERIEEMSTSLGHIDTRDMHIVNEIERVEEAVANARTLFENSIKDVNTMLKGLKSRLTP